MHGDWSRAMVKESKDFGYDLTMEQFFNRVFISASEIGEFSVYYTEFFG